MTERTVRSAFADLDFTLGKYERLCRAVASSRYTPVTMTAYLALGNEETARPHVIMRHDIDRAPQRAVGTAEVERACGIKATYYFRYRNETYVPALLDKIAGLGHEIGYHYETLDTCRGDVDAARRLFERELADFRTRYAVSTVCAHGNPLTKYDNKEIWNGARPADFGLAGEAFMCLDYTRFAYFSDSGRTWRNNKSQKMAGKDDVVTAFDEAPRRTDDVIDLVRQGTLPNICILTHPERWSADAAGFARRYMLDLAFSTGKTGIYLYRRIAQT